MFLRSTNNQKSDSAKLGLQGGTTYNPIRPPDAQVVVLLLVLS
jgi:hypothetical protein